MARTGDIGSFMLTAEGSIGSGLRRVEAVTGTAAEALAADTRATLETLSHTLGVPAAEVVGRVEQLQAELTETRRQLAAASRQSDQSTLESVLQGAVAVDLATSEPHDPMEVGGAALARHAHVLATEVAVADMRALRETGDWLRDHLPGPAVLMLGTTQPKRPQLLVTVPRELVNDGLDAGALLREVAAAMGAKGGWAAGHGAGRRRRSRAPGGGAGAGPRAGNRRFCAVATRPIRKKAAQAKRAGLGSAL